MQSGWRKLYQEWKSWHYATWADFFRLLHSVKQNFFSLWFKKEKKRRKRGRNGTGECFCVGFCLVVSTVNFLLEKCCSYWPTEKGLQSSECADNFSAQIPAILFSAVCGKPAVQGDACRSHWHCLCLFMCVKRIVSDSDQVLLLFPTVLNLIYVALIWKKVILSFIYLQENMYYPWGYLTVKHQISPSQWKEN